MRLTKKKAIEISIELWEWLAETGDDDKSNWDGWEKYGEMMFDCPLCEWARDGGIEDCRKCPYYKEFGRCAYRLNFATLFDKWFTANTPTIRKEYARLFLEQLLALK